MLMNMVLSSNVRMASLVEFSLGFLLIQPTIQKSRYHFLTLLFTLTLFSRILLASIKFLGQCPCPRCLVKKVDVPKMGMKSDLRRRDKLQRVDDHSRRHSVARAWSLIFEKGAPVSGTWVNNLLNDKSLVPTRVSSST
jgi:hypothetical protein